MDLEEEENWSGGEDMLLARILL